MSPASFVLPSAAGDWGIELITMRAYVDSEHARVAPDERDSQIGQLANSVDVFQADFGISIDSTAERVTLVTGSGAVLDHDTALHAMVALWCDSEVSEDIGRDVAVPVTASSAVETIATACGRGVRRTGTSRRALSTAALDPNIGFAGSRRGGFVFPHFLAAYDAMMSFGMLLRMLDSQQTTLDEVVAGLPPFNLRQESVFCPFDRKGAVMRTMAMLGDGRLGRGRSANPDRRRLGARLAACHRGGRPRACRGRHTGAGRCNAGALRGSRPRGDRARVAV